MLRKHPPRLRSIMQMVAWIGRYGKQPGWWVMRLPVSEALMLQDEIAQLMRDERDELERGSR